MSFTPEELAEMARADAEIEREFILTAEEAAESRELDRAEQKVVKLAKGADGAPVESDFTAEE